MGAAFCLGTVQMGMDYGVKNELQRQPAISESYEVLNEALHAGIEYFDTACSYGNSEEILGSFGLADKGGKIITKLPPGLPDTEDDALSALQHSLKTLHTDCLDACLLHRVEDLAKGKLWSGLRKAKAEGLVQHIGVSVYEPEDAVAIARSGQVDYLQVPYNILDQRLDHLHFFELVQAHGIKVFVRSVFLQGLLLMSGEEIPDCLAGAQPYIALFHKVAAAYGYSHKEAAMLYVLSHPGIDFVLFGVDTVGQLRENVLITQKLEGFSACRKALAAVFSEMDIPRHIINPSLWQKTIANDDNKQMFSLSGKTVAITGGAGHLGSAMSEALAAFGANLFLLGHDKEKNARKAAELKQKYHLKVCEFLPFSLEDTASAANALREVVERTGRLDVLINNAAYTSPATALEDYTDEGWARAIDGTINGVARMIRLALPQMLSQGYGSIINIGSMYGMVSPNMEIYGDSGQNNPANYGAGKAAIIQLTKYVACVYGGRGIRANAVSPGPFPNPQIQQDKEFIAQLSRKNPLGRIGQPEDLMGIIVYLASDASAYTNGQNIAVDGGWTAW